ncbi:MAG: AtpZ/AtpI family protein [Thermosulfidibacteraceae bacterium]
MKGILEDIKKERKLIKIITRLSAIGMELAFSIFIGLGLGILFDKTFGTRPWGLLAFLLWG